MIKPKDFLDGLEEIEKANERKAYRKNRKIPFGTRIPKCFFKYPIYRDLIDVIICQDIEKTIPRRWDELKIDFKDSSVRYCSLCNEEIHKVSNMHNFNEIRDKNVTIAVPRNSVLFKSIYNDFKKQIDRFVFVQISRRLIQEVGYNEDYDIHSCDFRRVIQFIISFFNSENYKSWVADYLEFGFDLDEFLFNI